MIKGMQEACSKYLKLLKDTEELNGEMKYLAAESFKEGWIQAERQADTPEERIRRGLPPYEKPPLGRKSQMPNELDRTLTVSINEPLVRHVSLKMTLKLSYSIGCSALELEKLDKSLDGQFQKLRGQLIDLLSSTPVLVK